MCLAVIDFDPSRTVPVRIVANRDEFRDRPAESMHWWPDQPMVAGKDLKAGGTWMGVDARRRFALLTNIRPGYIGTQSKLSRGHLIVDYLCGDESVEAFHTRILDDIGDYGGFNLLMGDASGIFWFSSDHPEGQWLSPGIHAISNDALNTPWPKTERARRQMQQHGHLIDQGSLTHGILASTDTASRSDLPNTGIPVDWETRLSAQTIIGDDYGTRVRTQLALSADQAHLTEQQIDLEGMPQSAVTFSLQR